MSVGLASAEDEIAAAAAEATLEEAELEAFANVPSSSYWGVRGLSQTVSAEPLGNGRVNLAVFGSYFKQEQEIMSPKPETNVFSGRAAFAWGVNSYVDVFALLPMSFTELSGKTNLAIGELVGGGKFSFPVPEESPFKLALQLHLIYGLTKSEGDDRNKVITGDRFTTLNDNYRRDTISTENYDSYAGYDYFDTRGTIDVVAKLAQSVILNSPSGRRAVKFHANEGFSFITGSESDMLLLLAGGIQLDPIEFFTVGVELNSRTRVKAPKLSDPLWLTPSIMYRSPWCFGVLAGIDINLSKDKNLYNGDKQVEGKTIKPLECWRVFGDIVFSFDFLAPKREAEARRAREEAAEKARLEAETKRLAAEKETMAQKAVEDSIRTAEEMARRAEADSLRIKAIADSLSQLMNAISQQALEREAQLLAEAEAKRVADSLARADLEKKLAEEKAKRSEAEQYLLTTGMLVLDAVYFTSGKDDLHINSRPYLGTVAKMLAKYPKLKIEIGGHTDNIGKFETNLTLSQKRAEAVFLQMVNVEPSLSQMLTSRGYGSTVPKADNKTAAGRELNRRVELKVLNPDVLKDYNP